MVHKNFTMALLAATVGACSPIPTKDALPEREPIPAQETSNTQSTDTPTLVDTEESLPPEDIWDRLRRGFQLNHHTSDPRVEDYIAYFSRNEGYMARVTQRARRYIFHVAEALDQANMPLELALLPIVESAYDPFAYSHARASGMWQFIPSTGRSLGLQQNWWYDGRRDVHESTRAAIKYFNYLSERFDGDWELVLAAYNSGEGTVRRAIERNRRKGLGTRFWDLKLPRETRHYVPQLLALAEVVSHPEQYQVPLHDVANQPYFVRVDVGSQIDLVQAADLAEIEIEELYLLNPGYNRWATDPNGNHQLLIPIGSHQQFESALKLLPKNQRVTWQHYTIVRGDTLSTIARDYQTTVSAIREANKLHNNNIRAGTTLLIPSASGPAGQYAYALDQRVRHRQSSGHGQKTRYTVQPGDSLWAIARKLKVSVKALASWNSMAPSDTLRPGRILIAYGSTPDNNSRTTRKVSYRVRSGDSLYRIASKFSIRIDDILRWNKLTKSKYLQPGQRLTLFVDSAGNQRKPF
ncbi:LysM peptidoglycan-binding domain-containing protein [Microbulbifer spongiae]|uniref:LysM peptidoglycan-binding domain-containing protein n=1 Tax=Microbulbifer spongiae TaxID=2944933 RepID=A0ABY9EFQ6_9GAMM|nr:LysM peptidoglycan-binding domain-containing protein [Microbulbifer sp. MI-G]WKD50851.1 LysM peptidoglycan-binding domain-containing protein [Microbulbifer sp. MI-G]